MGLTAVAAAAVLSMGSAGEPPVSFETSQDPIAGVVDNGRLFYWDVVAHRSAIGRFDMGTRSAQVLHRLSRPWETPDEMDAANGRVAVETIDGGRRIRTRVIAIEGDTGEVSELAESSFGYRGGCGGRVELDDVAPSGDVLVAETNVPCGSRAGSFTLTAYGREGPRVLLSRTARSISLSEAPSRRLSGQQLLTVGLRRARVRDLSTGAVRRMRPRRGYDAFIAGSVGSDGRVLLTEWREGPLTRFAVRLVGRGERGRGGSVVEASPGVAPGADFCGDRPVLSTFSRNRRASIRFVDPHELIWRGRVPNLDLFTTCDERDFVVISDFGRTRTRITAHRLPG